MGGGRKAFCYFDRMLRYRKVGLICLKVWAATLLWNESSDITASCSHRNVFKNKHKSRPSASKHMLNVSLIRLDHTRC